MYIKLILSLDRILATKCLRGNSFSTGNSANEKQIARMEPNPCPRIVEADELRFPTRRNPQWGRGKNEHGQKEPGGGGGIDIRR